jgi:TolB-like protein/Tfp pilus assembly protein PilF
MIGKSPKSMLSELRRRRVFNTMAIYIVGAWVALQVADLAFPGLEIPESAIRYVWVGAFALFPLILLFGWRYDISKGGIRRTLALDEDPETSQGLKPFDHWYIAALGTVSLVVSAVVLVRIAQVEPEILQAAPENSIAVMPFEVCEDRAADQAIAYQLATEVLDRLSERGTMKVIARTTAYNLAGFGWSAPRISQNLGVQHVLTGEVCRNGDALTITAELRDKDDFIVIRESYEQVVNPFDQIELHVATQVADAVAAELGDVALLASDAPVNRLAYEQLLIGRQFLEHRDWQKANESFQRALELQPGYPEAVFELAIMEIRLNPEKARVERLAAARQKAEEALELAKGEVERGAPGYYPHFVIAKVQHTLAHWEEAALWRDVELDNEEIARRKERAHQLFVESERYFRTALRLNPSHTETYEWLVDTIEHIGIERRAEAFEMMQRGLERDPFNPGYAGTVANRLNQRGRYREAMELLDRFAALPDGKRDLWWGQLEMQNNLGRFDDKLATQIEMLREDPESYQAWANLGHLFWLTSEMAGLGMLEEAAQLNELLLRVPIPESHWFLKVVRDDWYQDAIGEGEEVTARWVEKYAGSSNTEILDKWYVLVGAIAGHFWDAGERERAIELAESLSHMKQNPLWAERQTGTALWLAEMYLETGRESEALPILEQVLDYLEREVASGIRHPGTLGNLAHAQLLLGKNEAVFETLELAVDYGLYLPLAKRGDVVEKGYESDLFESIRDDPRFVVLADRAEAVKAQQVANIRSLLARNDMEQLLVPVIAMWEEKTAETAATE